MIKNIFLASFTTCLLGSQSFSQYLNMRNRAAWKSPSKPDTTSNLLNPFSEEDTSTLYPIPYTLYAFIVTASRTEKKIDDIGRSVSLISAEDIKNSGANSLAELLNLVEGIYIVGAQQNFGSNQSLFIRGANSNQSVIMIDGIPVSDPSTPGSTLDLSEIYLSEIDHLEIVRGSHSTLYGSSAIGGVINIITTKNGKEGMNINAAGTAGVFGKATSFIGENIGMNYTWKNGFYASMNFDNANVNGIDATVDTSAVSGMPRDRDGMDRFNYGGRAGYKNSRWDISVTGKNTQTSADIDDKEFDDDDNYRLDFERKWVSYSTSCRVDSGFSILLNGGYSYMTRTSLNDSSLVDGLGNYDQKFYKGVYKGETFTNELQLQFKQKGFSVILGGGSNDQMMNQDIYSYYKGFVFESSMDSLEPASRTNSFFLLADLNGTILSPKAKVFSLSLGARNNNNNTFGSSVTYQANPMLKVSSHSSVYAIVSSGYNAPSLYQIHSPDRDFVSAISIGNVNLRPETSLTKEFGVYQKINDHTGVRIGYYTMLTSDVIEYVFLWDKNINIHDLGNDPNRNDFRGDTYMNLGTLTAEGVEFEAHGAINKKFFLSGNFSYLRGKQRVSQDAIDTVKSEGNHVQLQSNGGFADAGDINITGLTRRPATANIAFTYSPSSKIFLKSIMKFVSERNDVYVKSDYTLGRIPSNAYTLVDLMSGIRFSQTISALVRVENIFNVSYSEIRGYSARGRGYYFSINYSF